MRDNNQNIFHNGKAFIFRRSDYRRGLDLFSANKKIIDLDLTRVGMGKKNDFSESKERLFFRGRISSQFYTRDSRLYLAPEDVQSSEKINFQNSFDSLSFRIVRQYRSYRPSGSDFFSRKLEEKYQEIKEGWADHSRELFLAFSPVRAWKFSVVAAILFGMVSMTMIYRFLGQQASAGNLIVNGSPQELIAYQDQILAAPFDFDTSQSGRVLGEEKVNLTGEDYSLSPDNISYIEKIITDAENRTDKEFEQEIREMVKGYPIELMVPNIMEKDRIVAAFLVGIAKKESNWGKRVPLYQGMDCFNYWGYKGPNRTGTGGHSCFANRKEAVDTVAKRLEWLVENQKRNTPEKMIIWKCGSSCAGHSDYDVQKWISDVNLYFHKLNKEKK